MADAQVLFLLFAKPVLRFQARADFLPPSDVFMRGHPAAVRHRMNRIGDDPAIGEFLDGGGVNDGVSNALLDVFVGIRMNLESQIQSVLDQLTYRRPGLYLLG